VAAGAVLMFEPWHGPIVLALSEHHGIDVGDLPAIVLIAAAVALLGRTRGARSEGRSWAGRHVGAAAVVALGALLMAGILVPRIGSPLVPAGGGTFGRETQHVDGRRAEPVDRWTHLAVTYDGSTYGLYVNGVETSSRSASGSILSTIDPLWIGGNHPYGEYFKGDVDEARVYDRALTPAQIRCAMLTPIAKRPREPGLVAAYGFDAGAGRTVRDASGNGNVAAIDGAKWTGAGRFGRGMRFDGAGELLSVPASASLDLTKAMTLMAWIKPSESQSGWHTILARQTDAYFLAAGGGRQDASRLAQLDQLRFVLVILLIASLAVALARGHAPWAMGSWRWVWLATLFAAGSLVDAALAPSDTLIAPALLALGCGATLSRLDEKVALYGVAAAFAAITFMSVGEPGVLPLPHSDGGVVRSAALGLVLVLLGLLSARRASPQARSVGG
jgi:hypothetical protein